MMKIKNQNPSNHIRLDASETTYNRMVNSKNIMEKIDIPIYIFSIFY